MLPSSRDHPRPLRHLGVATGVSAIVTLGFTALLIDNPLLVGPGAALADHPPLSTVDRGETRALTDLPAPDPATGPATSASGNASVVRVLAVLPTPEAAPAGIFTAPGSVLLEVTNPTEDPAGLSGTVSIVGDAAPTPTEPIVLTLPEAYRGLRLAAGATALLTVDLPAGLASPRVVDYAMEWHPDTERASASVTITDVRQLTGGGAPGGLSVTALPDGPYRSEHVWITGACTLNGRIVAAGSSAALARSGGDNTALPPEAVPQGNGEGGDADSGDVTSSMGTVVGPPATDTPARGDDRQSTTTTSVQLLLGPSGAPARPIAACVVTAVPWEPRGAS